MIPKIPFRFPSVFSRFQHHAAVLFFLALWLDPCAASAAGQGDVFLPQEGVAVAVPGFPGFMLKRTGQDVFLMDEKQTRLVGTLGEKPAEHDKKWPDVQALDLDFDKVPEFLLLQKSDSNDSLYALVHFKHGQNNGNYLFSDRSGFILTNPAFDQEKRVIISQTSLGYSKTYGYAPPARKYYPQYQEISYDYPRTMPTPSEAAARFFGVDMDAGRRSIRLDVYPVLQNDAPLSLMPGALSLNALPKASQVAVTKATPDGAWLYVSGLLDYAPRGWIKETDLTATIRQAAQMEPDVTDAAKAAQGGDCGPDLSPGMPVLVLDYKKDDAGAVFVRIRKICGLTGWVDEQVLKAGDHQN